MSKRFQGMIIGILIGALISGGFAYASVGSQQIKASYNNIKIVVDGKEIKPTDANGNAVEPFISGGTTYLPVRAVAGAFGKAVYWDGPNYTVYLGDMDGQLAYPTLRLKDAQNIGSSKWVILANETDNYGNIYSETCRSTTGSNPLTIAEYLLDMKYSEFRGVFYISSGSTNDYSYSFRVEADGNIIYSSPVLDKTSYPVNFSVNVRGYNHIKIIKTCSNRDAAIRLGDAGFYQ